ncbi:PQQ-binding-like beta-propeller repeat protein [Spiractinospora alimapuensis]|nr:PQQ-binding-like beta-propeller repeat protein [Spiractinospora alimapuensis]
MTSAAVAVTDGVVYVGTRAGGLYAVGADEGVAMWRTQVGSAIWSSPTVADGVVYVGGDDAHVHAVLA